MALGHYKREKSAKSKGTSPARKHPRKRCEMPRRASMREKVPKDERRKQYKAPKSEMTREVLL